MKEIYKDYTITVEQDTDAENPREDDNLGTMICFHSKFNLGDKHDFDPEEAYKLENKKDIIKLPLYLYDHSGITMSTTKFASSWDSGKVGFIYVTKEKIKKEYNWKYITKKRYSEIIRYLEAEVKMHNQYLTGDIYYYRIMEDYKEIDVCCSFYGKEHALLEAKCVIDGLIEHKEIQLELPFVLVDSLQ